MNKTLQRASFRDPDGFVFEHDGKIYRQINYTYKDNYDFFIQSGLYQELVQKKYILPFQEVEKDSKDYYRIIEPQKIDFITYPYEWCFSQYKDAALLTLKIQKAALKKGMSLKDATAYNIQFKDNMPIHIDTLSFEKLSETAPWRAYQQFCQHFLAPLALMAFVHTDLNNMMRNYIDGIPLDVASKLLPKFKNFGVFINIHLNSFFSNKHQHDFTQQTQINNMSLKKHLLLIDGLYNTILKLKLPKIASEWGEYYLDTNYNEESFAAKKHIISDLIEKLPKNTILWDMGANNGYFTRLATQQNLKAVSFDIDMNATEANYAHCRKFNEQNLLPLLLNLTNPSPSIGWNNEERLSLFQRKKPDIIMALALIHHLTISNNIPFEYIADCFSNLAPQLIIEYVAKEDSQTQKLLSNRKDIFTNYTETQFEKDFLKYYSSFEKYPIPNTKRIIYFFKK